MKTNCSLRRDLSALDFLNVVEMFERHGVTFVSVTQAAE
jgi:hypothetical protein